MASTSPPAENASTRRPRTFRFGRRTFCVLILLLSIGFGWIGILFNQAREQRHAASGVAQLAGRVYHTDRYSSRAPDWMTNVLGTDFFFTVFKVEIDSPQLNDNQLEELCQHLGGVPDLEIVNIHHASISDSGLRSLASLPSTVNLGMFFCLITDDGVTHLEKFGSSQEMWLVGTKVTEQGAARLREAIPGCAIMYDSDGHLSHEQMSDHLQRRGSYHGAK